MESQRSLKLAATAVAFLCSFALLYACGDDDNAGTSPQPEAGVGDGSNNSDSNVDGGGGPTDADAAGNSDSGVFYKSGTRLRAQLLKGADTSTPQFETFFDTVKNGTCEFVHAVDGSERCLPSSRTVAIYLDENCTQPAVSVNDCTVNAYTIATLSDQTNTCNAYQETVKEIRSVGAEIADAPYYVRQINGGCTKNTLGSGEKLHSVGAAAIPLTDYVAGHIQFEQVSSIKRPRIVADDGSELALSQPLIAIASDAGCDPQPIEPASTPPHYPLALSCIPSLFAISDPPYASFTDPGCTIPAAHFYPQVGCPATPTVIEQILRPDGGSNCGVDYGLAVYQIGPQLDAGFQNNVGVGCIQTTSDQQIFALGPQLPPSTFPAMSQGSLGTGRVRLFATQSTDNVIITERGMWDETLGTECSPAKFDDGKTYCVIDYLVGVPVNRFKDIGCTQPILITDTNRCFANKPLAILDGTGMCGSSGAPMIRPVGGTATVTGFYESNGAGGCSATQTPLQPGDTAYDVLPLAPITTVYAELTRVRE